MAFTATEEQVKQMAAAAINESHAVGLGALHFRVKVYTTADIVMTDWGVSLDYVDGRMVKLYIRRNDADPTRWECGRMPKPRLDYQSWAATYPTYEALAKSVGVQI